jgi:C-terminal processing protease CtpA/Prc
MCRASLQRIAAALGVAIWMLAASPAAAVDIDPNRGRLGFTVYVEVDGSYVKPVLKSVRVQEIEPGSPAEVSGLRVEDLILRVQGKPLAGADARDVVGIVQVPPGERLQLLVRGTDGAERQVTIVAGPPVNRRR